MLWLSSWLEPLRTRAVCVSFVNNVFSITSCHSLSIEPTTEHCPCEPSASRPATARPRVPGLSTITLVLLLEGYCRSSRFLIMWWCQQWVFSAQSSTIEITWSSYHRNVSISTAFFRHDYFGHLSQSFSESQDNLIRQLQDLDSQLKDLISHSP